jgi:hypothetical protein
VIDILKKLKKIIKKTIKDREKNWKKKGLGDVGMSHHSTSLINDPELKRISRLYWRN